MKPEYDDHLPDAELQVDRTISDLTSIEHFFDDRVFTVLVTFDHAPELKDAARLRRAVPALSGRSIAEIHRMLSEKAQWLVGEFHKREAVSLVDALSREQFSVSIAPEP